MPCPLCGDICRCSSPAHSAAASPHAGPETPEADAPSLPPPAEDSAPSHRNESAPDDSPAWREEVAARLSRYQARRKPRPPRYPSLRLRFEEENHPTDDRPTGDHATHDHRTDDHRNSDHRTEDLCTRAAGDVFVEPSTFLHRVATVSNQALALDGFADSVAHAVELPEPAPEAVSPRESPQPASPAISPTTAPNTAKIIEFPRSWTPPPPPLDELAEPVTDRPRILEAPEVVPPPPALGGITIEPAQQPETEKRPGIDIPLQSAPLARRVFSAAVDGVIIAAACALFAFIFWKLTAIRPPRFQTMGLAAGLSASFWAVYQYLLVVYSGATPGLRLARLVLARFDGSPASRRLRRWRVLASFLSAASLGMGYAWVFLDEDSLCWHDRITHTYLAPKGRQQHLGTDPLPSEHSELRW